MLTIEKIQGLIKQCEDHGVGSIEDDLLEEIVDNIRNAVVPPRFLPGRLVFALLQARLELERLRTAGSGDHDPSAPVALPPPPGSDAFMREILRAWLVGPDPDTTESRVVVQAAAFATEGMPNGGAGVWGVFLCDVARHISEALAKTGLSPSQGIALSEIAKLFNAELVDPDRDCVRTTTRMSDKQDA